MPDTEQHLSLTLQCDEDAPAAVRRALADRRQLGWAMGDVMLLTSELVSNAVRHSGASSDEVVCVDVRFEPRAVLVSVCDPGISGGAAKPTPEPLPFGGMGLRLVERLASRWGSEKASSGRHRVWAELSLQR